MKLLTAIKKTTYCDSNRYGPCCWETPDPEKWKDNKGNQQIFQKYVRSRAVICLCGIPLYTKKLQDTKLHWYWFWDLGPMYLPPSVTKNPGQYMHRAYLQKRNEFNSLMENQEVNR